MLCAFIGGCFFMALAVTLFDIIFGRNNNKLTAKSKNITKEDFILMLNLLIKEHGLNIEEVEFYSMDKVRFGMNVATPQEYPFFGIHKPTGISVFVDSGKNQHQSFILAIEELSKKLLMENDNSANKILHEAITY